MPVDLWTVSVNLVLFVFSLALAPCFSYDPEIEFVAGDGENYS